VVALTGEERHFDAREPVCLMGRLDVRVLGPLEVVGEDGFVPLPQGKVRTTLGALLIHPNTVVTTDRLIDAVWGAHPPTTAHKSIHVYISQLRRSLGADTILTRPPGYELRLERGHASRRCCTCVCPADRSRSTSPPMPVMAHRVRQW
jgi:hypothetical protein